MPSLRVVEAASIMDFVQGCADRGMLSGDVLDYGSGTEPYRYVVERAGGTYFPFDRIDNPGSRASTDVGADDVLSSRYWDAIVCTQVLQYIEDPGRLLEQFWRALKPGGSLVMTGPTNWPIVETQDLRRWTVAGIREELRLAGWEFVDAKPRAQVTFEGEEWLIGWQAVCTA